MNTKVIVPQVEEFIETIIKAVERLQSISPQSTIPKVYTDQKDHDDWMKKKSILDTKDKLEETLGSITEAEFCLSTAYDQCPLEDNHIICRSISDYRIVMNKMAGLIKREIDSL